MKMKKTIEQLIDGDKVHESEVVEVSDDTIDHIKKAEVSAAAAALGRITTEKKAKSSRENGKKGGRPKKGDYYLTLIYPSGSMAGVGGTYDTLEAAREAWKKTQGNVFVQHTDGRWWNGDGERVYF